MNQTKIISSIKLIILGLILSTGVGYIFAWNGPTSTPAGNNVSAPISATSTAQTKNGPLTVNYDDFASVGLKVLQHVQIVDGNEAVGSVLVSDARGIASWTATSSLGLASATLTPSGSIAGGCYSTGTSANSNGFATGATYGVWGNASTAYSSTYATPAQSANACTCPGTYTARITGQVMSSNTTGAVPEDVAFLCVKN